MRTSLGRLLQVGVSIVNILGDSSRVALISTLFGSIKALGIGISGEQLGSISVRSSVYEFTFNDPLDEIHLDAVRGLM